MEPTIQCIIISAGFSRDKESIMNPVPHNIFLSAVFRKVQMRTNEGKHTCPAVRVVQKEELKAVQTSCCSA
jgi:hypothetical protein